jgi:hypothetical protein
VGIPDTQGSSYPTKVAQFACSRRRSAVEGWSQLCNRARNAISSAALDRKERIMPPPMRAYVTRPDRATLLLTRIRGEYLEMPGLCLTPDQATRLWGLEPAECRALLEALVGAQFLTRTRDGAYQRAS